MVERNEGIRKHGRQAAAQNILDVLAASRHPAAPRLGDLGGRSLGRADSLRGYDRRRRDWCGLPRAGGHADPSRRPRRRPPGRQRRPGPSHWSCAIACPGIARERRVAPSACHGGYALLAELRFAVPTAWRDRAEAGGVRARAGPSPSNPTMAAPTCPRWPRSRT